MFTPLLSSRLTGQGRLESQAISERLGGYREAWALFKKHPFLGVGAGNYTAAVYKELDSSREPWANQPVHNSFLLAFVEMGMVGAILMFIAFMGILKILDIKDIFNLKYLVSNIKYLTIIPYSLFLILGLFDHYLWSLYSGVMLAAVGLGFCLVELRPGYRT
jgi:O-antigen ligase